MLKFSFIVGRHNQASQTNKEMFSTRFHFTLQDSLNAEENFSRNCQIALLCVYNWVLWLLLLAVRKGLSLLVETSHDLSPIPWGEMDTQTVSKQTLRREWLGWPLNVSTKPHECVLSSFGNRSRQQCLKSLLYQIKIQIIPVTYVCSAHLHLM